MRKPTIWVPTRSNTNSPVQSQKMVRGWKFCIEKVEKLYYPCSENKGFFVFALAKIQFSHDAAHSFYGVFNKWKYNVGDYQLLILYVWMRKYARCLKFLVFAIFVLLSNMLTIR